MEQEGRLEAAIKWARSEIQFEWNYNTASKAIAGRILGRCHAALGEHSLSAAAFDSAAKMEKTAQYVYSDCLTTRARAIAGKRAGGASGHWDEATGRERIQEVLGRMAGVAGGIAERTVLEERLLVSDT